MANGAMPSRVRGHGPGAISLAPDVYTRLLWILQDSFVGGGGLSPGWSKLITTRPKPLVDIGASPC